MLAAPDDAQLVVEEPLKHFSAQIAAVCGLSLGVHVLFGDCLVWVPEAGYE